MGERRFVMTEAEGYTRLDWWSWAPHTTEIAEAVAHSRSPDEECERGWGWARATRDACVRDGSPAHASWNRAAEVLAGISTYRAEVSP